MRDDITYQVFSLDREVCWVTVISHVIEAFFVHYLPSPDKGQRVWPLYPSVGRVREDTACCGEDGQMVVDSWPVGHPPVALF